MSFLVRAALLGGLAYAVSRAVRKPGGSTFLSRSDADRITDRMQSDDSRTSADSYDDADLAWRRSNQPSTIDA